MANIDHTLLTASPKLIERVKLGFTQVLRIAFSNVITHKDIRCSQVEKDTKLKIYHAFPNRVEFFPTLVVSVSGVNASMTYLQEDFLSEDEENIVYSGRLMMTVHLTCYTRTTLDREKIMDHTLIFVRHLFRDKMKEIGVEYKDITLSSEAQELDVENQVMYSQSVDIECYLEYKAQIDQSLVKTIKSIGLEITAEIVV